MTDMTPVPKRSLLRDFSLSAVAAGFVTVLVGFTSSAVIVFQAAQALGASQAQISSWMWALGLGMGITCMVLSLRYRMPVVTAWSTPGAAMLMTSSAGLPLSDAIGAFVLSALLMTVAGFSGVFERLLDRIPVSLASAMLAGVLLRFGLDVFVAMDTRPGMALTMFGVYLLGRRLMPRYAVIVTLLVGIAFALRQGLLHSGDLQLELARPVFIAPTLSLAAVFGIALPLFIVTMTSQNVPGVAVIRASGYHLPISPVLGWTGVTNMLLAPFGAYALNLAAITAAICMGREAHEDPHRLRGDGGRVPVRAGRLVRRHGGRVVCRVPQGIDHGHRRHRAVRHPGQQPGHRTARGKRPRAGADRVSGDCLGRVPGGRGLGVLGAGGGRRGLAGVSPHARLSIARFARDHRGRPGGHC